MHTKNVFGGGLHADDSDRHKREKQTPVHFLLVKHLSHSCHHHGDIQGQQQLQPQPESINISCFTRFKQNIEKLEI